MIEIELDNACIQELLDLGGDELLADLVSDFVGFSADACAAAQAGADAGDCPAVAAAAHSIKSSSSTLGATALGRAADEIEGAANRADLAAVRAKMPQFQELHRASAAALLARGGPAQ